MTPKTNVHRTASPSMAANDNGPYPTQLTGVLLDLAVLLGRAEARAMAAAQADAAANSVPSRSKAVGQDNKPTSSDAEGHKN